MTKARLLVLAKIPYDITPTAENKAELIQNIVAEMWPKDDQSTDRSTFVCYVNKCVHKSTNPDQAPMSPPIFGFEDPQGLLDIISTWDTWQEWTAHPVNDLRWSKYERAAGTDISRIIFAPDRNIKDLSSGSSLHAVMASHVIMLEQLSQYVWFEVETTHK